MTLFGTKLACVARSEYWFRTAAAAGGASVALATIAATLHGSASAASYWKSPALYVVYFLAGVAAIFFFLGAAGYPFPPAGDTGRAHQREADAGPRSTTRRPSQIPSHEQPLVVPETPGEPRSTVDLSKDPADLAEVAGAFDRPVSRSEKHLWCVKCGFPFTRPQNRATCEIDRPGDNWCKKRAFTPIAERRRRMALGANTLYRVHPDWAAPHEAQLQQDDHRKSDGEEWWTS